MAKTNDRVQHALDEARMLVLGAEVLLGFQLKSTFEAGFEKLPPLSQGLKMGAMAALVITIVLVMAPAAFHQIAERGEVTERLHRFATRAMAWALLPFAVAIGVDSFVAGERSAGLATGTWFGAGAALAAGVFWYGIGLVARRYRPQNRKEGKDMDKPKPDEGTKLEDKIKNVLTEAKVVLPGAQALLGFQFIATLMESFDRLPGWLKAIHLASLGLVALATILLMTPASYHRLVEEGEDTEHFHTFASRMVIASMVILPLGICGDVFVVLHKVWHRPDMALGGALALLAFAYGMWFLLTIYRRSEKTGKHPGVDAQHPRVAA